MMQLLNHQGMIVAMNQWWVKCISVLLLLGLAGCAALSPPKDENSPVYPVPVGSRLILHQDLEIQPGWARVYLQNGKIVKKPRGNPYCQFMVNDVLPVVQTITADEFVVRKTQMGRLNITMDNPVVLAAMSSVGSRGTDDVTLVWYLWLESPTQPNVLYLLCGGRHDYPHRARRLSINEIRNQLGEIATLITAEQEK